MSRDGRHRRFVLQRDEDVTGVSGTGVVAEGVEFNGGRVVLRWRVGEHRSTVNWDSIEAVSAIHGHDGRTRIVWLDDVAAIRAQDRAALQEIIRVCDAQHGALRLRMQVKEIAGRALGAEAAQEVKDA